VKNEVILRPRANVKYFVIAERYRSSAKLLVLLEAEKKLAILHEESFPLSGQELEL
jgi:hypothetical protein